MNTTQRYIVAAMTKTDDAAPPGESTPLLASAASSGGIDDDDDRRAGLALQGSFRRVSTAKLLSSQASQAKLMASLRNVEGGGAIDLDDIPAAHPVEGLAPLFPNGGIGEYDGRERVPYREASLVKSIPAFAPYRRKARHRSFYLWWTNVSVHLCNVS